MRPYHKKGDVKMSNRKQDRSAADFAAGAILAMTLFAGLVALGTAISGIPDCARGLAVRSAKLNVIATETESPDAPKQPASVSPRAAGELIRLSGFGGQDIEAAPEETEDPPSDEESPGELPYPEKAEHSDGKIVRKTYTYHPSTTYLELPGGGLLRNCTDIDPQYLLEQCAREPDIELHEKGEPLVLIMHTHTTESYEPVIRGYYDASFSSRTTELDKSVAEVGARIAEELSAAGIGVIHDTTVHDYPQYTGAYDRSAVTVEGYLEEYPSIQIVIDVHRDAIEEEGVRYAPSVEVDGKSAAQVMMICGCTNVPQYRYNLRIASRLQSRLERDYPGLTRPILFDERNYNQEMTHGSFLIEMGSNANALEEALYSGELVGRSLAELLCGMYGG